MLDSPCDVIDQQGSCSPPVVAPGHWTVINWPRFKKRNTTMKFIYHFQTYFFFFYTFIMYSVILFCFIFKCTLNVFWYQFTPNIIWSQDEIQIASSGTNLEQNFRETSLLPNRKIGRSCEIRETLITWQPHNANDDMNRFNHW